MKDIQSKHREHSRARRADGQKGGRTAMRGFGRGGEHRHQTHNEEPSRECGHRGEHHGGEHHGRRHKLGRLFAHGDLRLMVLAFIEEHPCHGYELMKSIEKASSGLYSPSAGVVYPTLNVLEDQLLIEVQDGGEGGRKIYQLTQLGAQEVDAQRNYIDKLKERLAQFGKPQNTQQYDQLSESMHRIKKALRQQMLNQQPQMDFSAYIEILTKAAEQLEQLNEENESKGAH
ncbi:PadR family transcriptional regulator [Celerinatantimonas sp. MCCC 1A17872]|uniref:PadR family transcriptional regulator n=1 Tax=Celerinatantimonas sp. MCCC 1A17872 TaxID=3177514 RepID=UPI0038C9D760